MDFWQTRLLEEGYLKLGDWDEGFEGPDFQDDIFMSSAHVEPPRNAAQTETTRESQEPTSTPRQPKAHEPLIATLRRPQPHTNID